MGKIITGGMRAHGLDKSNRTRYGDSKTEIENRTENIQNDSKSPGGEAHRREGIRGQEFRYDAQA